MSSATSKEPRKNIGLLLREPFRHASLRLHERFAERGHPEVRAPHGNVLQYLDHDGNVLQYLDHDGTRVSVLAERAQVTKQSMAELVAHLERHGYVERAPDPSDRRAKLVRATARGAEVYAIAREFIAELESEWTRRLGTTKMQQLRALLEDLNAVI
jgi:DNA-binding MarR family transcriptional regulator